MLRWLFPLLRKGYKKDLQINDIYGVLKNDKSERIGSRLQLCWDKELQKAKEQEKYRPNLLKAIANCFAFSYSILGIWTFIEECVCK